MGDTKTIVCLANSRKISGRCIAGKELLADGRYGGWIRPISTRSAGEISEDDRRFVSGESAQVLDIVNIPVKAHQPHGCQQENYIINDSDYWEKRGTVVWKDLASAVDVVSDKLWVNESSSNNGENDRIPKRNADTLKSSLLLIQPDQLTISVNVENPEFPNRKRKVRAIFCLNTYRYQLAVTDPKIELAFLKKGNGEYKVDARKILMCVSIGEPFHGFCYKLVASILRKPKW